MKWPKILNPKKGNFEQYLKILKLRRKKKGKLGTKFPFIILRIHQIVPKLKLHGEILPNFAILFIMPGIPK